jgi:Mn2+/Fe2+ NRAMP family transporter
MPLRAARCDRGCCARRIPDTLALCASGSTAVAEDDLPDPMEPGITVADPPADAPPLPKGDMRVPSWIALLSGIVVVLWYLLALVLGGVYFSTWAAGIIQIVIWALAIVAFACGIVALNARRYRELAAAGFIAGVVSLLVSLTLGLSAGLQVLY